MKTDQPDNEATRGICADLMDAEQALQKAALDFSSIWGATQTTHPKAYWLEKHFSNSRALAEAALAYADAADRTASAGNREEES
jgi:hypothetical protein